MKKFLEFFSSTLGVSLGAFAGIVVVCACTFFVCLSLSILGGSTPTPTPTIESITSTHTQQPPATDTSTATPTDFPTSTSPTNTSPPTETPSVTPTRTSFPTATRLTRTATSRPPVTVPLPVQPQYPAGVTAICKDGTYSYSQTASGTCSHHGGVKKWINKP